MNKIVVASLLSAVGAVVLSNVWRRLRKSRFGPIKKKQYIDLIGNTPLIYLKKLSEETKCHIFAKMEYLNPGGSVKDRLAKQIILDGEATKKLAKPGDKIYEGTSGSTGIALSLLANFKNYNTVFYLPDDLAEDKYRWLEICGAKIKKVRPVSIVDAAHFCKQAEREAKETNSYYADQFENLSNYKVHYTTTGPEIYRQTKGKINAFIASSGTGGTISGVSVYLKEKNPSIKVVLADPPGSSLCNRVNHGVLYTHREAEGHRERHPFDTITEGVGLNRLTQNFEKAVIDRAYKIPDDQTLRMAKYLVQKEGIFAGASSAMNCVAAVQTAKWLGEGNVIVTILCDSGARYINKFYSKSWLQNYNPNLASVLDEDINDLSFIK